MTLEAESETLIKTTSCRASWVARDLRDDERARAPAPPPRAGPRAGGARASAKST